MVSLRNKSFRASIIIPLITFITLTTNAQTSRIDSLLIALNYTDLDTNRVIIFNQLGYEFNDLDRDKALEYGENALRLSKQLNYIPGQIISYKTIGNAYNAFHSYVKAQDNFLNSIGIAEINNLTLLAEGSFNGLGNIYASQGNYKKALKYFNKTLNLRLKQTAKSVIILQNIADCYRELGQVDLALKYLENAKALRNQFNVDLDIPNFYSTLGMVYLSKKDYNLATQYLEASLDSLRKQKISHYLIPSILEQLAQVNIELGNFSRSRELLTEATEIALYNNSPEDLEAVNLTFSKLEEASGNYSKALMHFKVHQQVKDSITGILKREELAIRQHIFEMDQKQAELDLAKKNEEISSIQNDRQEVIIILGVVLIALTAGAITALAINYKKLQTKNKDSEKLNTIIQEQNLEIVNKNQRLQQKQNQLSKQNKELLDTINELRQTQSQLVQSEKMVSLGVLTAGIAHEINNPINFITSGIVGLKKALDVIKSVMSEYEQIDNSNIEKQLLKIEKLKIEKHFNLMMSTALKVVDNMNIGAKRAADIIKELRTFSRVDENNYEYTNIHEGIESTLVLLRSQYRNRIEIVRDFGKLPFIECSPGRLNQAFMNLIGNAIQAIEDKGEIIITTRRKEDKVAIAITDTGSGIPDNIKENILEPFFTTKETGQGTGLGLSITNSIIEDHNGSLQIDTVVGEGTTFTIILPIAQNKETSNT